MKKVKVAQAAEILGVSLNSVYRKVKQSEIKLNGQITKKNGVTFITAEGIEILRGLFTKLNPGETQASKEDQSIGYLKEIIDNQQKTLDYLIAQHAEERVRQSEERARADAIIMKLTQDVGKVQKLLEDTRAESLKKESLTKVNQSETLVKPRVKDPLMGKNWLQRLWIETFEPWRLRQQF